MDGGAWWAAVHGVSKSWTRLSDFTFTFYFHALEKEMATHSSVLAWRIPGMGELGGLPSMGSHRVGHDWSDLAAAAAAAAKTLCFVILVVTLQFIGHIFNLPSDVMQLHVFKWYCTTSYTEREFHNSILQFPPPQILCHHRHIFRLTLSTLNCCFSLVSYALK